MTPPSLADFVRESNAIEGITRDPTENEIGELERFLQLDEITIEELQRFVDVYEPGARLRNQPGLDVMVGGIVCPPGGPQLEEVLNGLLSEALSGANEIENDSTKSALAGITHLAFETLHPFTDCNGRAGRALWLWVMNGEIVRPFLHQWYYDSFLMVYELWTRQQRQAAAERSDDE